MPRGKNLDGLADLDEAVLAEVIREGEARLQAQFAAASSADQRGLAWAGFVITVATAAIGATAALSLSGQHLILAVITALLSVVFSASAGFAIDSIRPRHFAFPGNLPENWLPSEWAEGSTYTLIEARVEQATCLNNQIQDNADLARVVAERLRLSIDVAFAGTTVAALIVAFLAALGLAGQ